MVPVFSFIFMIISAIISIGLPIGLFFAWRKKYSLKFMPLLLGAAAFMLFKGLEQVMHFIVLQPDESSGIALMWSDPILYVIYGVLAAGIFEETGRFVAFHLLKRTYKDLGTGLSYGIGHGGTEAVLIAGLAMISSIIMSVMINTGDIARLGNDPSTLAEIEEFSRISPIMFFAPGFERIIAISLHISLSILVWCSVRVKGKLWLYPAAIILHAIVNIIPAMYQAHIITNIWLIEGLLIIPTALIALAAYKVCKILKKADDAEALKEAESEIVC